MKEWCQWSACVYEVKSRGGIAVSYDDINNDQRIRLNDIDAEIPLHNMYS